MAPLPGPAAPPRLLLLPASTASTPPQACQASSSPPRKRQRLAHLSPEEKALRRKLKNRVAAQSARDRKKARMGELERQAVEMEVQNQKLLAENRLLRERTHSLALENQELRLRLGLPVLEAGAAPEIAATAALKMEMLEYLEEEEEEEDDDGGDTSIRAATGSAESAVLRLRVPLQQGQAQKSHAMVVVAMAASTWIRMTLTLQILSLISSWAYLTAWIQSSSCTTAAQKQPAWRGCSRRCVEDKQIHYQPPPVPLWGPHHPSWRPLMN